MVVASPVGRKLYEVNNNSGVATNPAVHMHMKKTLTKRDKSIHFDIL